MLGIFTVGLSKKTMQELIACLCARGRVCDGHYCYLERERESRKRPTLHANLLHIWLGFSHILDKIYKD